MKAIRLIIFALLMLSIIPCFSQESAFKEEFQIIKKHKATLSKNGWVHFNKQMDLNDLLKDFDDPSIKNEIGLNAKDNFKNKDGQQLTTSISENLIFDGDTCGLLRLNQFHDGIKVEGAQLSMHFNKKGLVTLMHGKIAKNLPEQRLCL